MNASNNWAVTTVKDHCMYNVHTKHITIHIGTNSAKQVTFSRFKSGCRLTPHITIHSKKTTRISNQSQDCKKIEMKADLQ